MMDRIETALGAMAKSFGKHFTALKGSIDDLPEKIGLKRSLEQQTVMLAKVLGRIEDAVSREQKVEVTFDGSELKEGLSQAAESISAALPDAPDLGNIEAALKMIYGCIEKGAEAQAEALKALSDDIRKSLESAKKGGTQKVEIAEMQMRALTAGGGGGGSAGASKVTVANVAMTDANAEYSYSFPANTVAWSVKLRGQGKLLLYAFSAGKLPTSGDASAYMTAPQNYIQSQTGVEWSGKKIFVQADTASQVLEVVSYQL